MTEVISISDAKANLSRLVQRARAGETIYIGAYGQAEIVLSPIAKRRNVNLGVWNDRRTQGFDYGAEDLVEADREIVAMFDHSINEDIES